MRKCCPPSSSTVTCGKVRRARPPGVGLPRPMARTRPAPAISSTWWAPTLMRTTPALRKRRTLSAPTHGSSASRSLRRCSAMAISKSAPHPSSTSSTIQVGITWSSQVAYRCRIPRTLHYAPTKRKSTHRRVGSASLRWEFRTRCRAQAPSKKRAAKALLTRISHFSAAQASKTRPVPWF